MSNLIRLLIAVLISVLTSLGVEALPDIVGGDEAQGFLRWFAYAVLFCAGQGLALFILSPVISPIFDD